MEEEEATRGIDKAYNYLEHAAQAVVDRERYIREFLKNNHGENK